MLVLRRIRQLSRIKAICLNCGSSFEMWPSAYKKIKNHYCSRGCRVDARPKVTCACCDKVFNVPPSKLKDSGEYFCNRKCTRDYYVGSNNPNWKGGVTSELESLRKSKEFKEWRFKVFERDNFACQRCGDNSGGNLNAHHLKSFTRFPKYGTIIENGATLCTTCHREFHSTYGIKRFTPEDYFSWA